MERNWETINSIIENKCSGYIDGFRKLSDSEARTVEFLQDEINKFPDNKKTVSESAALFRSHLSKKYHDLSDDSIDNLSMIFCWLNR